MEELVQKAERERSLFSLRRNFGWIFPATIVYAGTQWALVVILAKIANVELVGQFALAAAVAVPITFLADFRLRVLFVTDVDDHWPFPELVSLRLLLCGLSIPLIVSVCAILHYATSTVVLTVAVGCYYLVDLISDSYYARLQRAERMERVAKSMITRSVISGSAFAGLLYFTHHLLLAVAGIIVSRTLVLLLYDVQANAGRRELFHPSWNMSHQFRMLYVAAPLAVCAVLVSINGYAPRYLLHSFMGDRAVGIFAAVNCLPAGCFLAISAMGYAVFPRLSKLFARGDTFGFKILLLKITGVYAAVGLVSLLVAIVAGPQILAILYKPEYALHANLLRALMVVGLINCVTTAMQSGLTAASEFRVQVPLFLLVTSISLSASAALIPRMGLMGAAAGVLISSIVQLCVSTALLFRTINKRVRKGHLASPQHLQPAVRSS
jgi:O-antigen/teichoic acid export membrane protein